MNLRQLLERTWTSRPFDFTEVWTVDFEYNVGGSGQRIRPLCMAAREARTGRELRYWREDLHRMREPPFPIDGRSVVVTYAAWAECECFRELGWPCPANILDLHAEHRVQTNGVLRPERRLEKNDLLTAAEVRGLEPMDTAEKRAMRDLILSKNAFTPEEQESILHYCLQDVRLTEKLLFRMLWALDLPRALWRGRYGWPVAAMQQTGVPIDVHLHRRLEANWQGVRRLMIQKLDRFGVYKGTAFNEELFLKVATGLGVPWPRFPSGHPKLDDDTFKEMASLYPAIRPIREARVLFNKMRRWGLTVDEETARNRYLITPWQSITGRNAPSNSHSVFGLSAWVRHLITPAPGTVLLYADWSSQEYVIAASLFQDERMLEDCTQGDPYIRYGQHGDLLPEGATKHTHGAERDRLKVAALATLYGQRAGSLSLRLGISQGEGAKLLDLHARLYPRFHAGQREYVAGCHAAGYAWTRLGWLYRLSHQTTRTSLQNWPMQSHGAEMLRIALVMLEAAGIRTCAPIHDAVLVECEEAEAAETAERVQSIMTKASLKLLGVAPRVAVKAIPYGERFAEQKRGAAMWRWVLHVLAEVEAEERRPSVFVGS